MQASRPHCELLVHAFAPGGTALQPPAKQYWPAWQSLFLPHTPEHTPLVQASSALQSLADAHRGSLVQVPLLQAQAELQSDVWEQVEPGQPKVHSSQGSLPLSMIVQPAKSSGVSNRAKREFIVFGRERGSFLSAPDSLRCLPFEG